MKDRFIEELRCQQTGVYTEFIAKAYSGRTDADPQKIQKNFFFVFPPFIYVLLYLRAKYFFEICASRDSILSLLPAFVSLLLVMILILDDSPDNVARM